MLLQYIYSENEQFLCVISIEFPTAKETVDNIF